VGDVNGRRGKCVCRHRSRLTHREECCDVRHRGVISKMCGSSPYWFLVFRKWQGVAAKSKKRHQVDVQEELQEVIAQVVRLSASDGKNCELRKWGSEREKSAWKRWVTNVDEVGQRRDVTCCVRNKDCCGR